ncbi:gamma carbonic anhydrase family protein [Plasticicumulans sp.]|uniref:gamma carbonic anhydrase family protein n=1 Tax=Plasticicumulans sp. TaxID=2307179 RepID=UPI000FA9FFB2|nr:gamma carbonic anhydrase family protein [Plasticicumulans sp.]MBS0602249.1 gamma carbonic anhydrase family protein [Pseudomonadota bacterium]RTK98693.1 MAG: gamma carbonic anhydrase family protein [Xanthomonadales bacterium]HMV40875.1 gamma carbonic anhydrase family protein [Plasticicumulans sp.]HMW29232.1 gamma carbonic anhydrase family protein [Plasticicumulans sp.]HMW41583.1 gamma carbonic anhydrase family protein [Plasticicumulans sp.]
MRYRLGDRRVVCPADGDWFIADDALVIGSVTLGVEASIWYRAVVRGDSEQISIGARSNVQDGAVLHADPGFPLTIGADVTVGHLAMLHGCTIGDGTLVGIQSTILNGAVIGEGCLIGAHTLIPERKVIPPRSLVMGVPGRVIRELDEAAVAGLLRSAAHYVANFRRHRLDLQVQD